ncbi:MAG: HPF/RaiA family ribosome-associated protein [Alphaproteobacteria bacterium]
MKVPLQITFRGSKSSPALEDRIRERVSRLEKFHPRITSCRVVVDAPHRRHRKGKLYRVAVDVTLPGEEKVAQRNRRSHHSHEDVHVAIRDAFDAVRRQLEDSVRVRRGQTKTHEPPPEGRVVRLFPHEGYGFIELEGQEIYFHRNSVVQDGFDALEVDCPVRLVVAYDESREGPQASTVKPVTRGRRGR